ncbi:uncharacterized protein K489DRAFT_198979 [Dissoconium aciculare CBS 342.82]|uniref:Uncharacterized protein n=1 Tax=Dissoconium aciculare CBS 342.82 TaxID=1314786 RepID=A0A6J3M7L3_9PEZI|nr:uncharacterized protein K489DRAFT_198979 [Dissoconium aciculare CBS 342.82]KAF1823539.1 hypothetical protein K489DRAFT_198979 [Dissoconium aciculare CBS 342.82]
MHALALGRSCECARSHAVVTSLYWTLVALNHALRARSEMSALRFIHHLHADTPKSLQRLGDQMGWMLVHPEGTSSSHCVGICYTFAQIPTSANLVWRQDDDSSSPCDVRRGFDVHSRGA